MKTTSFAEAYRDLLTELYYGGINEVNARTGVGIRMLPGGHSFKIDLSHLPVAGNRRYWPKVAAAETAWQFMGTKDPEFILKHAPKLWSKFIEDGELKTAYGYRWRRHFGRDQLAQAMNELRGNPTNRQLYISAWDPAADGLGGPQPMNIPCPVGFSLTRAGKDLHGSVFIRSSDVFVGLPYDVMVYALTLDAIALSVGCEFGTLHVTLAHPHFYEPHTEYIEDCIMGAHDDLVNRPDRTSWTENCQPRLPNWAVGEIMKRPDDYVAHVQKMAGSVANNKWDPMPALVI